jgi:hypothetical protein
MRSSGSTTLRFILHWIRTDDILALVRTAPCPTCGSTAGGRPASWDPQTAEDEAAPPVGELDHRVQNIRIRRDRTNAEGERDACCGRRHLGDSFSTRGSHEAPSDGDTGKGSDSEIDSHKP